MRINIKNTQETCLLHLISINMLALHGVEPRAYKRKRYGK